jgi:hypothetical protein
MLFGSVTIASRRMHPSQRGHASTSKPNVRFKSSAHGRYGLLRGTSAVSDSHGAGAGTDAASRLRSESGSRSTATVPSENAFFSAMRTRSSARA